MVIAERVRAAMGGRGLTQAELAAAIGFDPPKMSKSLSGHRRFTSLELARIADVCSVSVDFLLGVDRPTAALAARLSGQFESDAVEKARSQAERYAQRREDLAHLGYRLPDLDLRRPRLRGLMYEQGEALGAWAVEHVRGRSYQISGRDLAKAIEDSFAVDVAIAELPGNFDGLAWRNADSRLILVGTTAIPGRQRFTLAHELCHILAEDDQQLMKVEVDLENKQHKKEHSEIRANAFAAAFLMPADELKVAVEGGITRESFCDLSCELSVSPRALAYRLKNLSLISGVQCAEFSEITAPVAARIASRSKEFGEWIEFSRSERVPQLLVQDAFKAYMSGDTTLRPYASLIGVDVDTLSRELEASMDTSVLQ